MNYFYFIGYYIPNQRFDTHVMFEQENMAVKENGELQNQVYIFKDYNICSV